MRSTFPRSVCSHRRSSFLSFLALSLLLSLSPTPAAAQDGGRGVSYTFAFQNALISQASEEVFGALGVAFTIDPSVSGRISFRIDQKLTQAQLLQAYEAALAANGVALVRNGETLLVTSRNKAKGAAGIRQVDQGGARGGYEVVAVPLSYAVASEVAKAMEAIAGTGAVIYADDRLGLVILGGSGPELQSALATVKIFDQSGLQSSRIRWFELSQASAAMVATEIEALLRAAGIGGVSVAPLKRLNGIIVFGRTTQALDEVSQWVIKLDVPTRDAASSLWVYRPQNTTAEALGKTLNSLNSTQLSVEAVAPAMTRDRSSPAADGSAAAISTSGQIAGSDDQIRAAVDKQTNTLLVSAPSWRWLQIQKILAEIDRPQSQLLIEASILEVTLTNDFRLGVDWSVFSGDGKWNIQSSTNATGAIGPTFPGLSVTFLGTDIQAAVNALGSRASVEVVSAPKLLTLDNHTASLQVGDQIPVITQTSQGTSTPDSPIINAIDYRNSGVILNVTPRISGADRIVLEVAQEVSSVIRTRSSGIDSPTIQQRKFESTLVVGDGAVVALGGLIGRTRNNEDAGVPGVKDIPGLGNLFKSSSRNESRTELIVLLSATIIRDRAGSDRVLNELIADMREVQSRGLMDAGR